MGNLEVKKLNKIQHSMLDPIGERYNLRLMVVYGSWAKGVADERSDLDIGVLSTKLEFEFDTLLSLWADLEEMLSPQRGFAELDVKSLHKVDPLFRWQVMKDSILIYGSEFDYVSFKIYAWRDYQESQSLFRLEETMAKKGLVLLRKGLKEKDDVKSGIY